VASFVLLNIRQHISSQNTVHFDSFYRFKPVNNQFLKYHHCKPVSVHFSVLETTHMIVRVDEAKMPAIKMFDFDQEFFERSLKIDIGEKREIWTVALEK
jgi:hypothetical protein